MSGPIVMPRRIGECEPDGFGCSSRAENHDRRRRMRHLQRQRVAASGLRGLSAWLLTTSVCCASNFIPGPVVLLGLNSALGWGSVGIAIFVGTLIRGGVFQRNQVFDRCWLAAVMLSLASLLLAIPATLFAWLILPATADEIQFSSVATVLLLIFEVVAVSSWWRIQERRSSQRTGGERRLLQRPWFWSVIQSSLLTSLILLGIFLKAVVDNPSPSLTAVRCHLNQVLLENAVRDAYGETVEYQEFRRRQFSDSSELPTGNPERSQLLKYLPAELWPECPHGTYELDSTGWSFRCSHPEHQSQR